MIQYYQISFTDTNNNCSVTASGTTGGGVNLCPPDSTWVPNPGTTWTCGGDYCSGTGTLDGVQIGIHSDCVSGCETSTACPPLYMYQAVVEVECTYDPPTFGCNDNTACNYNFAYDGCEDGTNSCCTYPIENCSCNDDNGGQGVICESDGSTQCNAEDCPIAGCTTIGDCNYNSSATIHAAGDCTGIPAAGSADDSPSWSNQEYCYNNQPTSCASDCPCNTWVTGCNVEACNEFENQVDLRQKKRNCVNNTADAVCNMHNNNCGCYEDAVSCNDTIDASISEQNSSTSVITGQSLLFTGTANDASPGDDIEDYKPQYWRMYLITGNIEGPDYTEGVIYSTGELSEEVSSDAWNYVAPSNSSLNTGAQTIYFTSDLTINGESLPSSEYYYLVFDVADNYENNSFDPIGEDDTVFYGPINVISQIIGCMDDTACNYDETANVEGECISESNDNFGTSCCPEDQITCCVDSESDGFCDDPSGATDIQYCGTDCTDAGNYIDTESPDERFGCLDTPGPSAWEPPINYNYRSDGQDVTEHDSKYCMSFDALYVFANNHLNNYLPNGYYDDDQYPGEFPSDGFYQPYINDTLRVFIDLDEYWVFDNFYSEIEDGGWGDQWAGNTTMMIDYSYDENDGFNNEESVFVNNLDMVDDIYRNDDHKWSSVGHTYTEVGEYIIRVQFSLPGVTLYHRDFSFSVTTQAPSEVKILDHNANEYEDNNTLYDGEDGLTGNLSSKFLAASYIDPDTSEEDLHFIWTIIEPDGNEIIRDCDNYACPNNIDYGWKNFRQQIGIYRITLRVEERDNESKFDEKTITVEVLDNFFLQLDEFINDNPMTDYEDNQYQNLDDFLSNNLTQEELLTTFNDVCESCGTNVIEPPSEEFNIINPSIPITANIWNFVGFGYPNPAPAGMLAFASFDGGLTEGDMFQGPSNPDGTISTMTWNAQTMSWDGQENFDLQPGRGYRIFLQNSGNFQWATQLSINTCGNELAYNYNPLCSSELGMCQPIDSEVEVDCASYSDVDTCNNVEGCEFQPFILCYGDDSDCCIADIEGVYDYYDNRYCGDESALNYNPNLSDCQSSPSDCLYDDATTQTTSIGTLLLNDLKFLLDFAVLNELIEYDIFDNDLSSSPEIVTELIDVTDNYVAWDVGRIVEIDINNLANLVLPYSIGVLSKLSNISITNSDLEFIPSSINERVKTENFNILAVDTINLSSNSLNLKSLRDGNWNPVLDNDIVNVDLSGYLSIDLSNNPLSTIPESVLIQLDEQTGKFTNVSGNLIQTLNLSNINMEEIPASISDIGTNAAYGLQTLNISNNAFPTNYELPSHLWELSKFESCFCGMAHETTNINGVLGWRHWDPPGWGTPEGWYNYSCIGPTVEDTYCSPYGSPEADALAMEYYGKTCDFPTSHGYIVLPGQDGTSDYLINDNTLMDCWENGGIVQEVDYSDWGTRGSNCQLKIDAGECGFKNGNEPCEPGDTGCSACPDGYFDGYYYPYYTGAGCYRGLINLDISNNDQLIWTTSNEYIKESSYILDLNASSNDYTSFTDMLCPRLFNLNLSNNSLTTETFNSSNEDINSVLLPRNQFYEYGLILDNLDLSYNNFTSFPTNLLLERRMTKLNMSNNDGLELNDNYDIDCVSTRIPSIGCPDGDTTLTFDYYDNTTDDNSIDETGNDIGESQWWYGIFENTYNLDFSFTGMTSIPQGLISKFYYFVTETPESSPFNGDVEQLSNFGIRVDGLCLANSGNHFTNLMNDGYIYFNEPGDMNPNNKDQYC